MRDKRESATTPVNELAHVRMDAMLDEIMRRRSIIDRCVSEDDPPLTNRVRAIVQKHLDNDKGFLRSDWLDEYADDCAVLDVEIREQFNLTKELGDD